MFAFRPLALEKYGICSDEGDVRFSTEKGGLMESLNPLHDVYIAQFRLPGFDGAAFTLRTLILPESLPGRDRVSLAFDVGLLTPDRKVEYLARKADLEFVMRLAAFFWSAANDFHPEQTVPILTQDSLGFTMAIVSSSDFRIAIQITLVEELGANMLEFDVLNFETSRLALTTTAREVRDLVRVKRWSDLDEEVEP